LAGVYPILSFFTRIMLGIGLALVLGVAGIVIARLGDVFFGLTSWTVWFALFLSGAGLGAGIGSLLAWLGSNPLPRAVIVAALLLAVLAGVAGGWGAYSFGRAQEVECCAGAGLSPLAYTVLGATVGANLMAWFLGLVGPVFIKGRARAYR
jgi:hypothetical protein